MAKVYISEYADVRAAAGYEPHTADQTVTSAATSTQTSAFNVETHFVRVHTDGIISIAFGSNPTATTDKLRMAAGQTEYFYVIPGHKAAVITNT